MTGTPTDTDRAATTPPKRPDRTPMIILALVALVAALAVIWVTESPLALVLLLPALLVLVRALVGVKAPDDGPRL